LFACVVFAAANAVAQENWPRFRGADASGVVADDSRLPDTWDQTTNIEWKVTIPGSGWGSPIVWGDRVFVSAVHSDDEYEKPKGGLYLGGGRGEPPDSVHHWMVYCLSLKSGEVVWEHEAHTGKPQIPRHPKNTYAAETPTTDGKRLYVLFGDLGMYCYDFEGQQLWAHQIEPKKTKLGYGAAASPVLEGDQVIMVYDNEEESYIAAFDSATGRIRWKTPRDEKTTWATPLVWRHDGKTEIVATGKNQNRSYSTSGDVLWNFDGQMSVLTIPSPFAVDGLLYITSGYFQDPKRPVFALKPGASGDITLGE
jgi:outer membrane protein assembly factor BamB